jgi:hypothetical protein
MSDGSTRDHVIVNPKSKIYLGLLQMKYGEVFILLHSEILEADNSLEVEAWATHY